MSGSIFGLAPVTFITVMGVPVVIIVLLALWGVTFDGRVVSAENKKHGVDGGAA
jgi:hypothetical protein